jgi:hypothetical protein
VCEHVNAIRGTDPTRQPFEVLIDLTHNFAVCMPCVASFVGVLESAKAADPDGFAEAFGVDDLCDVCGEPSERFRPALGPLAPNTWVAYHECRACADWAHAAEVTP